MNTIQKPDIRLINGCCVQQMKGLPDHSVDLFLTDPPYYKIVKAAFDHCWADFNSYLDFIEAVGVEFKRILKPHGALLIFADDRRAAYLQYRLDSHFRLLNHLVWNKPNAFGIKHAKAMKMFAPVTERILYYASSDQNRSPLQILLDDPNHFTGLRGYFEEFQAALGLSRGQINKSLGHQKAEHAFRWDRTQWGIPTEKTYSQLLRLPRSSKFAPRSWSELKAEYDQLKSSYPRQGKSRFFQYLPGLKEVLTYPTQAGQWFKSPHPTTKNVHLLETLIQATCPPGGLVLDAFMGSGTTGMACRLTDRRFLGIEKDPKWYKLAWDRINNLGNLLPKNHPMKEKL